MKKFLLALLLTLTAAFAGAQVGTQGTGTGPRAATATGWGAPAAAAVASSAYTFSGWATGTQVFTVNGVFADTVTIQIAGSQNYTWTVVGENRSISCGRYCVNKPTVKTRIDSAVLKDWNGTVYPLGVSSYMPIGTYTLTVTGDGYGTYTAFQGVYDVTVARY